MIEINIRNIKSDNNETLLITGMYKDSPESKILGFIEPERFVLRPGKMEIFNLLLTLKY